MPRWCNRFRRRLTALLVLSALPAAACGGGSARRSAGGRTPTVVVLEANGPDSLDPAVGDTPQALEADWLVYTPLLAYEHADGAPGTNIFPALANGRAAITDGGRTYTLTLRKGLAYSNGHAVKASDFTWAVERAIKLWPPAGKFITGRIVGARAFATGRAKSISGIATDDATGQITIRLTAPDGAFDNVLALPVMAPVPAGTPFTDEAGSPPPGVGMYTIAKVVPGKSFSLVKNSAWPRLRVPYLPRAAHVDVDVRITGDAQANARSVLANTADVFDWPDQIPADLMTQIEQTASDRYVPRVMDGTDAIFMNVTRKPFSSQLARQAVRAALDQDTVDQLDAGRLQRGCYLVPPTLYGHPHDACPEGNPAGDGNLPLAKTLVKQSGMAGGLVTVWSPGSSPARSSMAYYASLLDQLGFKATLKVVPAQSYYRTIGQLSRHPQTGFAEYPEKIPSPVDFDGPLNGRAIKPTHNRNWGEVNDPSINSNLHVLATVPARRLSAVHGFWNQLERYIASKAYVAVLGYPTVPEFVSDRIDLRTLVFSSVAGYDFSSIRLK
jgi:peptide/nickel transport system substrate-binding protein